MPGERYVTNDQSDQSGSAVWTDWRTGTATETDHDEAARENRRRLGLDYSAGDDPLSSDPRPLPGYGDHLRKLATNALYLGDPDDILPY